MEKDEIIKKYKDRLVQYVSMFAYTFNIDLKNNTEQINYIFEKCGLLDIKDLEDLIDGIEFSEIN